MPNVAVINEDGCLLLVFDRSVSTVSITQYRLHRRFVYMHRWLILIERKPCGA